MVFQTLPRESLRYKSKILGIAKPPPQITLLLNLKPTIVLMGRPTESIQAAEHLLRQIAAVNLLITTIALESNEALSRLFFFWSPPRSSILAFWPLQMNLLPS